MCSRCGLVRTLERAEDYDALYTEGERYHAEAMDAIQRPHYRERFHHDRALALNSRVPKILAQLRSLDVGSANGGFVEAMSLTGFDAEGLELNPHMAEWSAQRSGLKIHTDWSTVRGPFDLVTYHDVYEHVVSPDDELRRVRDYLRADGLLVIDQPDAAEVFGDGARAPHHLKPSQHLWFFTEQSMKRLLQHHGFIVELVERPIVGKLVMYARKNV